MANTFQVQFVLKFILIISVSSRLAKCNLLPAISNDNTIDPRLSTTCPDTGRNCAALVNGSLETYPNYANLKTIDLIQMFGYNGTEHQVTTDDDYILTLQRIASKSGSGPPIFLMHGILCSSAQWFWQPPNRALVFMLFDAGYDVWLGNARGTSYSLGHTNLDSRFLPYWDFSSFEMGKFDIPAVIKFITSSTGQDMYYIGHSLGGQQFFIAMSLFPELNSKIRTMFALAPSVFQGNATNSFRKAGGVFYSQYPVQVAANILGNGRFVPEVAQQFMGELLQYCSISAVNCGLCTYFYSSIGGLDPCQTNFTTLPGFLAHIPDSISSKTFSHSSQNIQSGDFAQYDYGTVKNMFVYKQFSPPKYNLSNVVAPIVLFWGESDDTVVPQDISKLVAALPADTIKENNKVNYPAWTHNDFITAIDGDVFVYNKIIDILNNARYG